MIRRRALISNTQKKKKDKERKNEIRKTDRNKDIILATKNAGTCAFCSLPFKDLLRQGAIESTEIVFHHVKGEKLFKISRGLGKTKNQLNTEMAKCEMVCFHVHDQSRQKTKPAGQEPKPIKELVKANFRCPIVQGLKP